MTIAPQLRGWISLPRMWPPSVLRRPFLTPWLIFELPLLRHIAVSAADRSLVGHAGEYCDISPSIWANG
ncbi:hypothetical protein ADL15_22240 [Actinoplanes awajinensis subsp. mycoplanecinus]|uniref:Uncharacterized protein n=1 Tax=Actinoplanes awajinensis subsp. mycoplanecinus TaxID=135947 RepID=A0A101JR24_9ACTN|nr:hypothetical protein ADL15_22240 [Actinoplanes awajinensis subsp. mycoplanecinus]